MTISLMSIWSGTFWVKDILFHWWIIDLVRCNTSKNRICKAMTCWQGHYCLTRCSAYCLASSITEKRERKDLSLDTHQAQTCNYVFKVQTCSLTIPDLEKFIDMFLFKRWESSLGMLHVISFSVTFVVGCECLVWPDPTRWSPALSSGWEAAISTKLGSGPRNSEYCCFSIQLTELVCNSRCKAVCNSLD